MEYEWKGGRKQKKKDEMKERGKVSRLTGE